MTVTDVAQAWAVTEREALAMIVAGFSVTRWSKAAVIGALVDLGRGGPPIVRFDVAVAVLTACGSREHGVLALLEHDCDVWRLADSDTEMGRRVSLWRDNRGLHKLRDEAQRVYRDMMDFGASLLIMKMMEECK